MKPNTKAFATAVTLTLTPLLGIALAVLMKSGDENDKEGAGSLSTSLPSPTKLILVPHTGDTTLDRRIRDAQEAITAGHTPVASLDRLEWCH